MGGGAVSVPFSDFSIGGKFKVSNPTLKVGLKDGGFVVGLKGMVSVSIPGSSASAEGTIQINSNGQIGGELESFSLQLAGMQFAVKDVSIDGSTFKAKSAGLKLPKAFGGAGVTLYGVSISPSGISIQGGKLELPEIKAGGFQIKASGELRKEGSGYLIKAEGLIKVDALSVGPGCSGIGATLTVYTDSFGQMVVEMEPNRGLHAADERHQDVPRVGVCR